MPLSCWIPECMLVDLLGGGMAENQHSTPLVTVCRIFQKLWVRARNLLSAEVCFRYWDMHLNASESLGDTFDEYFINHNSPFITGDWSYSNNVFTSTISNRIHSALLTSSRLFFSSPQWLLGRERHKGRMQHWTMTGKKRVMARCSHSPGLCVV